MTTMTVQPALTAPTRSLRDTAFATRRWIRETPAPRWEGDASAKATFVGYVGASMVTWTFLGMLGAAIFGQLLKAVG